MASETPAEGARRGLFDAIKGLAADALAIVRTRAELLSVELAEEKERLLSLLLFGVAALFFCGLGIVFFALFLTVLLWESHRLLVLGIFAGLFLGTGVLVGVLALGRVRAGSRLFSASLAELARDREALR